ncbi:MAG TPA: glycoside hydrolase family 1 protein [Candidatus Limnocylindria bacterium]
MARLAIRSPRRAAAVAFGIAGILMVTVSGGYVLAGRIEMSRTPRTSTSATFPDGFLFGTATAAHQVEGDNRNNDYYEWETEGRTPVAGAADDEYHRYDEDFGIASSLSQNAFRLSIEWSRIEPAEGVFSESEVAHYIAVLTDARAHGLKTFVTLHHFTNPIWAADRGGWANDDMVRWFSDYVAYLVPRIGGLVDYWLTVNEPNGNAFTGYLVGATPPGKTDVALTGRVLANYLKAHAAAYHLIHASFPTALVSLAEHFRILDPARWWDPADKLMADILSSFFNDQPLDALVTGHLRLFVPTLLDIEEDVWTLKGTLDFIGVNYYTRSVVRTDASQPEGFRLENMPDAAVSASDEEIYPAGLYRVLLSLRRYALPLFITENGIDDPTDALRSSFICDHLAAVAAAMADGADVRGYLYWSLIDNYEWTRGYTPKYGLAAVDFATERRTLRPSAAVFSAIARTRSLEPCAAPTRSP